MATAAAPSNVTTNTPTRVTQAASDNIARFVRDCAQYLSNNFNLREKLLEMDRQYAREMDLTDEQRKNHLANARGDASKLQNITVPVVMPQTETQLAYLSNKFLTGYPIFPVVSPPLKSDAALQMETLVAEHALKFGWVPELAMAMRDGLKYNIGAVEICWANKKILALTTDQTKIATGTKQDQTVETYYQGNYLKRLNMYNTIMDTRVQNPSRMHIEGEFTGYTELLGKMALKQLLSDLGSENTMNATKAFESGGANFSSTAGNTAAYYIPEINPRALLNPQAAAFNWFAWAGLETNNKIKYSNMYEVTTLYARIMPIDFGIQSKAPNTPQIWKFIVVNRQIPIYAERQTNAHNYLPILFLQPLEDGLGWQTKSFSENSVPMQQASTALFNSGLESQRKKVYDRLLYDPSRIAKKDIEVTSSVARIPVKQQAYGTELSAAVYAVPYNDTEVASVLQFANMISGELANTVSGQNRVSQGQFQKGNKTRHEFQDVMDHSDARSQMMAMLLEYRFFQPLKEIIKLNIIQYQPPTTLFNRDVSQTVQIDPATIRATALEFKLADGIIPSDVIQSSDGFQILLQMSASNPMMAASYDIVGAFAYFLQLNGCSWINDFKRNPAQQQQFLAQSQAQNNGAAQGQAPNGQPLPIPAPATGTVQ